MKRIIIIFFLFSLASCKKVREGCWTCQLQGTYNGISYVGQQRDTCTGSDTPPVFTNSSGVNITGACDKK